MWPSGPVPSQGTRGTQISENLPSPGPEGRKSRGTQRDGGTRPVPCVPHFSDFIKEIFQIFFLLHFFKDNNNKYYFKYKNWFILDNICIYNLKIPVIQNLNSIFTFKIQIWNYNSRITFRILIQIPDLSFKFKIQVHNSEFKKKEFELQIWNKNLRFAFKIRNRN